MLTNWSQQQALTSHNKQQTLTQKGQRAKGAPTNESMKQQFEAQTHNEQFQHYQPVRMGAEVSRTARRVAVANVPAVRSSISPATLSLHPPARDAASISFSIFTWSAGL